MAYFTSVADMLQEQGTVSPWIQMSASFQALLSELKHYCYQYKLEHLAWA